MRQKSATPLIRLQAAMLALGAALIASPLASVRAEDINLPPVSVGAGIRTSFTSTDFDGSDEDINDFTLDSARIYISGKVTETISVMFNTEYNGASDGDRRVDVIDAAVQFAFSDQFNIWAGRFLPPSDRANLYGPYYASNWGVFRDGVQDGYLFETTGRDDGVMYWGQFGIAKVSFGVFDVPQTRGDSDVLYAGRVQLDFWDAEGGYYLNGSYYGDKDLLAVGVAAQKVRSSTGITGDFLLEKKLGSGGVVTVEAEIADYQAPQGYVGGVDADSDGYYVLGAYMFAPVVGIGRFQVLGKYGEATYKFLSGDEDLKTLELNVNYIIKQQSARISLFYIDQELAGSDVKQYGLGVQVQI
ncbi:porin [Povalibacter sp.]|uniref:porin n=1 Tax=Povalibacter sp. TaxID=1962978 RepID=UPI002F40D5DA